MLVTRFFLRGGGRVRKSNRLMSETSKKRYAAVGTGGRITSFIDAIATEYKDTSELVALCDPSLVRARFHQDRLQKECGYHEVPVFHTDDFDKMVDEQKPDVIIVCTVDAYHNEWIVRAVKRGLDVITEKPMTTDDAKCREILAAVEETGEDVRVTFNYRWAPGATKVKEVLASGVIGDIKHVNLEYMLNTSHGADYFRRWHSYKDKSGGLLVHKSTHHFDLVNWWIDAVPEEVFAYGDLVFYGKENAVKRGDEKYTKYPRYTGHDTGDDPFALKLEKEGSLGLYRSAEEESGYIRDQNVFREGITIEDTMSVLVKYRTGAFLTYSLNAFCPVEGFRVTFSGDKGRVEYTEMHNSHIIMGQSDKELSAEQKKGKQHRKHLRVIPLFQEGYDVEIEEREGGHGGADPLLREQIYSANPPEEKLNRNAGHEQGAASILVGVAANKAMVTGAPVKILDLAPLKPSAKNLSELR